jgi:hypothetical protein
VHPTLWSAFHIYLFKPRRVSITSTPVPVEPLAPSQNLDFLGEGLSRHLEFPLALSWDPLAVLNLISEQTPSITAMKEILRGNVIAITGDFGKSRSTENLKRWIENNGARYATKIEEGVTHLICSKDHWAKQVSTGKNSPPFVSRQLC